MKTRSRANRLLLISASCLWLSLPSAAAAHDFWVQPERFWIEPQTSTSITLQVGHGTDRQRSPIPLSRIARFSALGPHGRALDIRAGLHLGEENNDGAIQFGEPGAYMLSLETDNHAQSHLPAPRFNDYLNAEGLQPALMQRARTHQTEVDGSESYRRVAKAIILVGPSDPAAQTSITARLGLPLEIVLEENPFALSQGAPLTVRIYYQARPLAGALVKFNDLGHDATPMETHTTDNEGRASFSAPYHGAWQFNVIWTRSLPASSETDFDTIFSSLSFGYPAS